MTFKAFLRSVLIAALVALLAACSQDGSGNTTDVTTATPDPVVTLLGDNTVSVDQGESYSDLGATALDSEGETIQVTTSGEVDTSTAGTYTLTYTAVDSDGNTATTTRTVTVVDKTPPVITLLGDGTVSVDQYAAYSEPGATAKDGDVDVDVVISGTVDTSIAGEYTLTYTATDEAGNSANTSRTINVIDKTPPVVMLIGESQIDVLQNSAYDESGATAKDGETDVDVVITGSVDTSISGEYTLTYTATDEAGNSASESRIITVLDRTPPVITLIGDSSMDVLQDSAYSEPGATAKDGTTDVEVVTTGTVDTAIVGVYTITYTATDSAGNSTTISRTVNVLDVTPPVVTLTGGSQINLLQNAVYSELGATAKDGETDVEVAITGVVDTSTIGEYIITYTATDASGNTASATRTVKVTGGVVSKTFTYDIFGRVVNEDFGDGRSIAYTYDDSGNLINQTVVGGE